MGRTKTENYSLAQNTFAVFNQCFSCTSRVAMLEFLLSRKQCSAEQLIELLDLDQCTVRKHLSQLVKTGFAKMHFQSRRVVYSANTTLIQQWQCMVGMLLHVGLDAGDTQEIRPELISKKSHPKNWIEGLREFLSQAEIEKFGLPTEALAPGPDNLTQFP